MSQLDFYQAHYADLFKPLLGLMRHGVALDLDKAAELRANLLNKCEDIQQKLAHIAGAYECSCSHDIDDHVQRPRPVVLTKTGKPKKRQPPPEDVCELCDCGQFTSRGQPLHAKSDLSSTRVVKFLYEYLGFPKQRKRGEENPTGDELAVRRLVLRAKRWKDEDHKRVAADAALWKRDPDLAIRACQLILEHREKFKRSGFLDDSKVDEDGRLRCQYKFTTTTGRLASRSNPYGSGSNLQNIDRSVREVFIPDEGCLFLEGDLSQAESRVVYALTGDPDLIKLARTLPWEYDTHTHNAAMIFGVPVEQVTKEQRYLGKRGIHASHYGMHGKKLSEALLLDGFIRTADECQAMIDTYMMARPAIRAWQRSVRKELMRYGQLENSWGRVLSFRGERMNDDTYRKGYAFKPSSEIADLLNQWGLVPLYWWLRENRMRSRINLQCHDALLISVRPDEVWDVMQAMRGFLERPRSYGGVELTIPVEWKLGTTWKCEVEFKKPPGQEELEAAVEKLRRKRDNS